MGFFSKRPRTLLQPSLTGNLGAYGTAVLDARRQGRPVSDPRFGWEFVGQIFPAMGGSDREAVIQELYDAASGAPDRTLATVGAYALLAEYDGNLDDRRFRLMQDATLDHMHALKFSSGHLTGYEADRWVETHGDLRSSFDNIFEVGVPSPGAAPEGTALEPGQSRMIALTEPLPHGNAFFAEHCPDGTYIVYSERCRSNEDPTRVRSDETYLGTFTTLPDLLRAVGRMFGTEPYWAEDDLKPWFPSRRA